MCTIRTLHFKWLYIHTYTHCPIGYQYLQGISEQRVGQSGVADKRAQRSAGGQENGHHEESGQEPILTSIEQQFEDEFGSEEVSFENGDKSSDKDSDVEVDSSSDNHSDNDSDDEKDSHSDNDKDSHSDNDKDSSSDDDNASAAHRSGPPLSLSGKCDTVDEKHTHKSEEQDEGSEKSGTKYNVVFGEEAQEEVEGVVEEEGDELEDRRVEHGKEKEMESEGEGRMNESGIMEKAEQGGNGVSQVASDNGKEDIEEQEGKCEGADVVKNDDVENETKDSVGVILSMEGDDSNQLAARENGEAQACELVSPTPEGEGNDPVVSPVPSSQEVEPGLGVVKGELEGGATSGIDPTNTVQ